VKGTGEEKVIRGHGNGDDGDDGRPHAQIHAEGGTSWLVGPFEKLRPRTIGASARSLEHVRRGFWRNHRLRRALISPGEEERQCGVDASRVPRFTYAHE